MKIGILGAGNVGGALGKGWARKGHEIGFGSRDPSAPAMQSLVSHCAGRACSLTLADAAQFGEVVVCSLPWHAAQGVLAEVDVRGKTLLDTTNPLKQDLSGLELGTTSSGGELVAQWAEGANVVKIFNTTGFGNMENSTYAGGPIPLFYCGDAPEAKKIAAGLASDLGFAPVDVGPLTNARALEPQAMLWIWLAYLGGLGQNFAFQIVKR